MYTEKAQNLKPVLLKRQRKSKETRLNDFMKSAQKIFSEKGYDATTVRDIAREAGCSDGLMFRYFKSKSDLLFAIIKQGKINSQKEIEENFSFSVSVEEQIYKIMELYIDKFKDSEQLIRVILSRALTDPDFEEYKSVFKDTSFLKIQVDHFKERQKLGEISADYDCEALALLIYSITFILGFNRRSLLGIPREECLSLAKRYAKLISSGI
ncbi:TetR/AcrR family transcriptional regulator [Silvanigrella aquatica]|nr:TetR/AcrR family transcriptional regulator [Silvanigrella aquatica]